jgi:hypothetical protein
MISSNIVQRYSKPQPDYIFESPTASNVIDYRLHKSEGIKIVEPYGSVIFKIPTTAASEIMNNVLAMEMRILN